MNDNRKWILELKEDLTNPEDLIIEFPNDLLEQAGWKSGDTLIWEIEGDSIILRKKEE